MPAAQAKPNGLRSVGNEILSGLDNAAQIVDKGYELGW